MLDTATGLQLRQALTLIDEDLLSRPEKPWQENSSGYRHPFR
jgi:hypothetical protein